MFVSGSLFICKTDMVVNDTRSLLFTILQAQVILRERFNIVADQYHI